MSAAVTRSRSTCRSATTNGCR